MNDGFRQRLVGALVLICLALIIWPILFSDRSAPPMERGSQIPPLPAFETFSVAEPVRPETVEPVDTVIVEEQAPAGQAAAEPEPATQQDKAKRQVALDKRGLPVAWVLQVASFTRQQQADELVKKLQRKGYKAFAKASAVEGKTVVRVYVGPKLSQQALQAAKQDIDRSFKLKSMIIRFQVKN